MRVKRIDVIDHLLIGAPPRKFPSSAASAFEVDDQHRKLDLSPVESTLAKLVDLC